MIPPDNDAERPHYNILYSAKGGQSSLGYITFLRPKLTGKKMDPWLKTQIQCMTFAFQGRKGCRLFPVLECAVADSRYINIFCRGVGVNGTSVIQANNPSSNDLFAVKLKEFMQSVKHDIVVNKVAFPQMSLSRVMVPCSFTEPMRMIGQEMIHIIDGKLTKKNFEALHTSMKNWVSSFNSDDNGFMFATGVKLLKDLCETVIRVHL